MNATEQSNQLRRLRLLRGQAQDTDEFDAQAAFYLEELGLLSIIAQRALNESVRRRATQMLENKLI